ncbi:alpha/beta hydrolase [Methanobrevibacter sp.]|uniref:alpha/beta hydrolase n=1 Tax=Methanobrevibacter sp. TaxID=66852 RepID=UPI0026DEB65F|nr:alpha/beta hydrolase [Methanobrevibacter sp.]MDO5823303.1 alpha/beta hydrolase [Methanobrevibacter sp.]
MNKKVKITILIAVAVLALFFIYYVTDYYPAERIATDSLNNDSNVSVVEISKGLLFDGPGNESALIFYPGAKVEYTSYAPLLKNLSSQGVDCYLLHMPFNLAFFGQNSADDIIKNSSYKHYFLSGHSLGGVMASSYINSTNASDGLILFASYPSSQIEKPVLSIYGSEDKVLNMDNYFKSKGLVKNNFTEFVINGGNHAQFGYYGNQSGDGMAQIPADIQQNQAIDKIISFIDEVLA